MIASVNVASAILAARLIVLIAVVGAIVLTWAALGDPNPWRLALVGAYGLLVVAPCVWLAGR